MDADSVTSRVTRDTLQRIIVLFNRSHQQGRLPHADKTARDLENLPLVGPCSPRPALESVVGACHQACQTSAKCPEQRPIKLRSGFGKYGGRDEETADGNKSQSSRLSCAVM
jgi:hypothetical protein